MRYPILISLLYFFLFNQTSLIIQSWLSTISIFQTLVIYHHSQKMIYIYIYMSRFRHFERKEKEWEKEICIYLILFPKSSKQSSKHNVHFTRLEGWKEELARRLSLHLPSLLSRKTTILASSCRFPSPWPQEPLKKNRWRSISSTNGIARNHLRRQPNLEAPGWSPGSSLFSTESNGRAGNAHPPLLHRPAPLRCLRGGVDQWHGGNVRLTTWPLEPPPHFPWLTSTTPL